MWQYGNNRDEKNGEKVSQLPKSLSLTEVASTHTKGNV